MKTLCDEIEALIAEKDLPAGARLPSERALAASLGVSRPKLREAIKHLSSRGILTSRQGGGTFVAVPGVMLSFAQAPAPLSSLAAGEPGYWQDVMEIRKSLDADMAYYAALRAGEADKARLHAALERVTMAGGDDAATQARADAAFHMAVAEASHNAVLRQIMAGLFGLLQQSISESLEKLYRLASTAQSLEQQHTEIATAILDGRAEDARHAARGHLDFVEDSLRRLEEAAARQRRSSRALLLTPSQKEG